MVSMIRSEKRFHLKGSVKVRFLVRFIPIFILALAVSIACNCWSLPDTSKAWRYYFEEKFDEAHNEIGHLKNNEICSVDDYLHLVMMDMLFFMRKNNGYKIVECTKLINCVAYGRYIHQE